MVKYFSFVTLLILASWLSPSQAATLDIRNGVLFGATGVTANGLEYDVSFVGDSCISLFDGCDEETDFFFNDPDLAHEANIALDSQVFVDSALGNFDSEPYLTNGCTHFRDCGILTPTDVSGAYIEGRFLLNSSIEGRDSPNGVFSVVGRAADFGSDNYPFNTYAVWSAVVPIPAAFWLLGSALLGLVPLRRGLRDTGD